MSQLPPIPTNTLTAPPISENNNNRLIRTSSSSAASLPESSLSIINKKSDNNKGAILTKRAYRLSNTLIEAQTSTSINNTNAPITTNSVVPTIAKTISVVEPSASFGNRLPTPDIIAASHILPTSSKSLLKKLSTSAPQSPRNSIGSSSCNSVGNSPQTLDTQMFEINNQITSSPTSASITVSKDVNSTIKSPSSRSVSSSVNYIPARKYSDTFESS